ncbi:hypothetical protein RUM44_010442 [Polyplax serrata]|uniref:Uncharacterized protein n=1 Tax=Polyplax serrata TaxID=468196 RepID=A0ABR1AVJ1_POLSC
MSIENEIIFKWTNLCRLCLSAESHIDLFSPDVLSQDCLSKIRSCLNLLVYPGDPMPTKICSKCQIKLDEWYQFRKECLQSEANVKTRLKPYQDIKFVKEYFQRCAKFESSEIVSSSSKTNTNSIHHSDEVNSSIPSQEYPQGLVRKKARKSTAGPLSHKLKVLGLKKNSFFFSGNSCSDGIGKPVKSEESHGTFRHEPLSENNRIKRNNLEWVGIESGLMGTIESVTGSASALWDSQCHNKHSDEANDFYGNGESCNRGIKNSHNSFSLQCPNCETEFANEDEFELHACCMIGSSTHLEDEEDGDEHFEDSISLASEYDGYDSYMGDYLQSSDEIPPPVARIKITPWKCIPCHMYFQSCLDLRRHYSTMTCMGKKVRALDCEFCYRQFLSFNDLLQHQITHITIKLDLTEDDLICCNQCSMQFPNERRLKNHFLIHTLNKKLPSKYNCKECNEVFFHLDTYENHLLYNHQLENEADSPPDPMELASVTYDSETPDAADQTLPVDVTLEEEEEEEEEEEDEDPDELEKAKETKKPQSAIRCFRCGLMFVSVKQLEHHEAMKHKNPTPYICRKCGLRFSARSQLLMHLRVHMSKSSSKTSGVDSEKTNSCAICDAKFFLQSDLESHMKTHKFGNSDPPSPTGPQIQSEEGDNNDLYARYKCSLCSRLYVRANSCIRHGQQSHKGQKVVPLRLKRSVFVGRRTSLPPGGKVKHKCLKCPKYFFSFNAFSVHSYKDHGVKLPNPAEEVPSLETEETPESPKPDEVESKCPFCSKDIKPSYISLHIKKFHRGEVLDPAMIEKDIPTDSCICRYCFKTCSTPHNRKLHESIHYPVKAQKNQCETCGQKLSDRSLYEEHTRTCKSIRCGKCHKIFFKFTNLTQHCCNGTKSDEIHKCTVCLSAFTSLDLLQIHIKNFHGKKPESIPQPGTSRHSAKRLDREIWREESNKIVCMVGEKFYCTFCDCEFSTMQESNEHRVAHPRGNWYAVQISDCLFQCTICDKFFETRKSSLLHINYHKKSLMSESKRNYPLSIEPEVEIFTDLKTIDTPKMKKFNCRYCAAAFRDEENLQEHLFHSHVNQT